MNAKEMLDKAVQILARSDVDRALLLLFMNAARREVLREKTIRKFFDYRTVSHTSGVISGNNTNLKFAHRVEYLADEDSLIQLKRFKSLDQTREAGYKDLSLTGNPAYYLDMGVDIWVIPVPTSGTLKIYGEFWPANLTDSVMSSDVTTVEMPEAFIYLSAAEYFDYYDEGDKGQYWRQKGMAIVENYLAQDSKQYTYGVGMTSDSLGNGGVW